METLVKLVIKNWIWPLVGILGGSMISRLWIGKVLRSEVETHAASLEVMQKGFNQLVWNERLPAGMQEVGVTLPLLGQFCWDEIRTPLRMCTYVFWNRKDRQAIRTFLKYEEVFKGQPNYLELEVEDRANSYSSYLKKHLWCYNFMKNIGEIGTNQKSCTEYGGLAKAYNLTLEKSEAFSLYAQDAGIEILSEKASHDLISRIAQQVTET